MAWSSFVVGPDPRSVRAIELDHGGAARAVEILQAESPYDLSQTPQFPFGTMYPVHIRGLAYLKVGQGENAATEFQRILDHLGVVVNFPWHRLPVCN